MNFRYWLRTLLVIPIIGSLLIGKTSAQCVGGLDSIQQVSIDITCGGMVTVNWPTHASYCYSLSLGTSLLSSGQGLGSVSFAKSAVGVGSGVQFYINEACSNSGLPCMSDTTSVDILTGFLPNLDSAGTWNFQTSGIPGLTYNNISAMNSQDSARAFTLQSPTSIPDLVSEASLSATTTNIVRPSCGMSGSSLDSNGMFTITTTFDANSLDSLTWMTVGPDNMTTKVDSSISPIVLNSTQTSASFKVAGSGSNMPAGSYKTTIFGFVGTCSGSVMVTTNVLPGSDEPVVACNNDINLSVDGQCMLDVHVGMVLAGTSSPCTTGLMDSLVIKHASGEVIKTINVGSGNADTVRIEDASAYIGKSLMVEVHSSNNLVSNTCWGNLTIEDKLPPILTCDTLTVVSCFQFDGDITDHIQAIDCDPNPKINLINEVPITDCAQLPNDSILKRFIRTFNAVDQFGNVSNTCSDTLDVRRLDANTGNGDILDIAGLKIPLNFRVDNTSSPLDTNAFQCDITQPFADIDGPNGGSDGIPDPVDSIIVNGQVLYGAGIPRIDTVINGERIYFELHPTNVSAPHDNAIKLFESCKTTVTYSDLVYPKIGCVQKVLRTWYINEYACSNTKLEFRQQIEIIDSEGPVIEAPVDMKVTTNQVSCGRRMLIPPLVDLYDNCPNSTVKKVIVNVKNGVYVASISTDAGSYSTTSGGYVDISIGSDTVVFHAFDDCHNESTDTMIIEVVDETAPVVICKEFLVVGLANDGVVRVPTAAVNNGTFDDCGLQSDCVVRMSDLLKFDSLQAANVGDTINGGVWYVPLSEMNGECGRVFTKSGTTNSGTDYIVRADLCTTHIEYCCEDASITDMVVYRATDKQGNSNQCMVEISIQDKRIPAVHCPPDLTIDCRFAYASDAELSIFGNVVAQGQQKAINIPQDQILGIQSGKNLTDGVWFGNCEATVAVSVSEGLDQCGGGTIRRIFTVSANGSSTSCTQTITMSRENVVKPDDIIWPNDTTITGCSLPSSFPPDSTGYPTIAEDACTLIGSAHQDLTVRFNDNNGDACFKIIREWTVIDWCKTPSITLGVKTQEIKVNDNVDPVITGSCDATIVPTSGCGNSPVTLTKSGSDNCTDDINLQWTLQVDFDSDGSIDDVQTMTGSGTAQFTGNYPIGAHRAIWELRDQCGNTAVCEQMFSIRNSTIPSAICRTSITGPLVPVDDGSSQNGHPDDHIAGDNIADGGEKVIWANEYDIKSSTHPCGLDIIYSFDSLSIVPSLILTCANYNPATQGDSVIIPIVVFVHAVEITTVNGVQDTTLVSYSSCDVQFKLHDGQNACDGTPNNPANVIITGNIRTTDNQNLATVEVDLQGVNSTASTLATETNIYGMYAFPSMDKGGSYQLKPELDKDLLNGVSTLDLVMIQKHILGLDRLDNPYDIIAADVNNDRIISAVDLIELRKVILGVTDRFTNNESWRFVYSDYEFNDPVYPLSENIEESYAINILESNMSVDFIGMKTGDVNGSVNVAGLISSPRSFASVRIEDRSFQAGEIVSISVAFNGIESIQGFQFAMKIDPLVLRFKGFASDKINLSSENFGTRDIENGLLRTSWNSSVPMDVGSSDVFVMEFEARSSGRISEALNIDQTDMSPEVYDQRLERIGLGMEFLSDDDVVSGEMSLLQNSPNPFFENTEIVFVMPRAGEASLKIMDISGKLLVDYSDNYIKGLNYVKVSKSELNTAPGVLIYTLEFEGTTITKEMILLE